MNVTVLARQVVPAAVGVLLAASAAHAVAAQTPPATQQPAPAVPAVPGVPAQIVTSADADPRVGLRAGWDDAGTAIRNLELLASRPRSDGLFDPANPTASGYSNTDLAFAGNYAFIGNYYGWQAFDISDPANPRLHVTVVCPGGQGDLSVHGSLLVMSAQETRGRLDCGTQGVQDTVSTVRLRGVRIFDISDIDNPRQVAAVQTCRGSHTHTLVTNPADPSRLYVYISGTSAPRPASEMEGCSALGPDEDPNTSYWRIEVIEVPVATPERARIVSAPRVFADEAGNIAGLWQGGDHGEGTQRSRGTNQCHDITAYPGIGLAAGACAGNGILLDISDPVNPVRIEAVVDPNFAYWHSATFSNDGSKVIFTDEWGGGSQPRCRASDPPTWGANAIFTLTDRRLELASYYKMPAAQTDTENCVAHNGSLIPVPGRDIKVQAWYQGGISIFDFTDASNPVEIAFFDRGPISDSTLTSGGYWSAYWYNGYIYGAEIYRGFDVFRLVPSEHLTQNEIAAAELARMDEFNAQHQPTLSWPASFVVPRAYIDQLERGRDLSDVRIAELRAALDAAERLADGSASQKSEASAQIDALATALESTGATGDTQPAPARVGAFVTSLRSLAASLR